MSGETPPIALEAEVTPICVQTLVSGVAPITLAQRLAIQADSPLQPRRPQRPTNHGLFDLGARNQIEMFG
jgi:hypothetical protein